MKPTILFSAILFAICGLSYSAFTQVVNIPDASFKAALVGNYYINTNGDGEIQTSEAANTGSINVNSKNIVVLTGIEAFTALTYLRCEGNQLTSLDVSANTVLNTLWCFDNQLTSLNVSSNTTLTELVCSWNQLTSLNVKNGNNTNMLLYANGNPNLGCINVDNAAWSTANWIDIDTESGKR